MVYDLPLVEEKIKPHQITTLHLVSALAFIVAGAIIFVYNYTIPAWGFALLGEGIVLLVLTIVKNRWVTGPKINTRLRIGELIIALTVLGYSALQGWKFPMIIFGMLSAALAFALYWEKTADAVLMIRVDEQGIQLPVTYRKRLIPWIEIDDVVLRFGTLTANGAQNHFYQWNIGPNDTDREIFEAYCKAQIEEHSKNRRKDDW
jgi:hypothetical protein